MSFSKPRERLQRPTNKYAKFSGRRVIESKEDEVFARPTDGKFYYYDKDKKEDVVLDMIGKPFIVLDQDLFSVGGFNNSRKLYSWSNEVRSVESELVVRYFNDEKEIALKGPWTEIKNEAAEIGANYTRCVYIMFAGSDEIIHLSVARVALRGWMEAVGSQQHKLMTNYVVLKSIEKDKTDATLFYRPVFDIGDEISEEDVETAKKLDGTVQEYLDKYLEKDHNQTPEYDRDDTNTDSWMSIDSGDGVDLGDMSLSSLNKLREKIESENNEDGALYQFVCRGILEKQKSDKDPKKEEQKEEKKSGGLRDLLKKKKANEVDESWKDVDLPQEINGCTKLGELDKESLEELRETMNDHADLRTEYPELYEGVKDAFEAPM